MAITYSWKITSLKKREFGSMSGVIFQTYWEKIGTDENGNTGKFSGATPFDPSTIDPTNFIPFEQLTEEIILNWIKAVVVGQYEEHVNDQIKKQIDSKMAGQEELKFGNFPWQK